MKISQHNKNKGTFIIAEVGQAHDGSLGLAHSFIDAAHAAGADAIKFQTHIASEESTIDEPFRVNFSYQDMTRYDYWKRMEFNEVQWKGLADHAKKLGLVFLSSPFSLEAVKMLKRIGVDIWKIGSGETESSQIFDEIISYKDSIILSSGMSNWSEITKTVNYLEQNEVNYVLLQCTSMYPTPLKSVGLNVIKEMKEKFSCPVGLSDHSGTIFPSIHALANEIDVLELHVTFDKSMFGPDTTSSINFKDLNLVCKTRDAFHLMKNNPINKDEMSKSMESLRSSFRKSIAPRMTLKAGEILTQSMLTFKKPSTGIPSNELSNVLGKKLKNDVKKNCVLKWEDIEQ